MMQKKIVSAFWTLVVVVILFQVLAASVEPYLGWIGSTLAIVIIVLLVGASIGAIFALVRFLAGKRNKTDWFNG